MRTNLIISAIGDTSVHRSWLDAPALREFDLFLIYYGDRDDLARHDATYYLRRKGMKFEQIKFASCEWASSITPYEYVWCPDDDVALGTVAINAMFALMRQYELELAQPAIAKGDVSHLAVRQQPGNLLRYSPFVEVMCPVFSREAFAKLLPTFTESRSSWGLDLIWPKLLTSGKLAILDKIGAHHTRPLMSGEHYKRMKELGIDPRAEMRAVVNRFGGIDWGSFRRFSSGRLRMHAIPDPQALPSRNWRRAKSA